MAEPSVQNQGQSRQAAGPGRGRRRPQGRGGKGGARPKNAASSPSPAAPTASTPDGEKTEVGSSFEHIESPGAQTQADVQPDDDDAHQDEPDLCWICAEPIKYYAVSDCNHRTCHVCALRLRALYKKLDCTFCKVRAASPPHPMAVVEPFDQRAQGTTTHSRVHPFL
jgi:E3 ubiquitin-protein ligase ZNF598